MDRIRYHRSEQFVYQFIIKTQPLSLQANRRHLSQYIKKIELEAKKNIDSIITTDDIDIEITWTSVDQAGIRSDIDNIIKPIIDALKDVAFNDDKQVRTVVATYLDRNRQHRIDGYVEDLKELFYSTTRNVIQVSIYSDAKLIEKGGQDFVRKYFLKKKLNLHHEPDEKI